jgi:hypothetical protein
MKIYTTVEAVPSRMVAVVRLLALVGPASRDEVVGLLQPGRDATLQAANTLSAAVECGCVERAGDSFALTPGLLPADTAPAALDEALRRVLARLLLRTAVGGEPNGFATLCAWLLQLPVDGVPSNRGGLKERLRSSGYTLEELQIANDARWDNVIYWARYLGLVRQILDEPCGRVVADPTDYLRRHLSELIQPGEEVSAAEFRSRLGALCPVLDGGDARAAVIARVDPNWPEDQFSDSLTFSLERLNRTSELRSWCPDDQRTFIRTSTGGRVAFLAL